VTETLDCTGLLCPLPVYKAGIVLGRLAPGDVLELVTTDPGALEDVPALARQRGDVLLAAEKGDDFQKFWLQKGGSR
ncbi:MAG: sulfurtransferase TusA family protein, partial [Acidimicrobiia bacterium]